MDYLADMNIMDHARVDEMNLPNMKIVQAKAVRKENAVDLSNVKKQ